MDKKKIIKICIAFVAIILLVLCIYYGRNYYIINKISKMQEKYMNATNYSFVDIPEKREDMPQFITEHYYKDGNAKEVLKLGEEIKNISWYNKKDKVLISISPNNNSASIEFSDSGNVTRIPTLSNNFLDKIDMALNSKISSCDLEGEKCWCLEKGTKIYISKESGLKLKVYTGTSIDENGIENENSLYYKDVKLNSVTDEDVTAPSLDGYNVTDYRENQKKFGGW